ncbi:MAG: metallophosphoesterase [Candidatus Lokiarchaeota archaeon]|nr:metallophosphoesterase [Candidatus Lokiarchaeota archaeon]
MKILHISDFHFGTSSIDEDTIYPTISEDFLYRTKKFILENLSIPDLLIFTGDLVSKGNTMNLENPIIFDFLQPFIDKKIPILICNGNHDLKEENIENKTQFIDYVKFMEKNKNKFRINLSNNFRQNQSAYIDFAKENNLFISLNSCHNILTNKEKDYKKPATLPYKLTDQFFNELKKKYKKKFKYRNKLVIIHHPLEKLKNHHNTIRILKENGIKIIFAGDSHIFSKYNYEGIIGLTTGTLYGSNKIRWDSLNLEMQPNQFNYYDIDTDRNLLNISQYIHDLETGEWRLKEKYPLNISMCSAWNLENWCLSLNIESTFHELKKESIILIVEDLSKNADYIAIKKNNKILKIFIQERENQNYKVNFIKSYLKKKTINNKEIDIKIIDKTGKLKGQLPSNIIIECKENVKIN